MSRMFVIPLRILSSFCVKSSSSILPRKATKTVKSPSSALFSSTSSCLFSSSSTFMFPMQQSASSSASSQTPESMSESLLRSNDSVLWDSEGTERRCAILGVATGPCYAEIEQGNKHVNTITGLGCCTSLFYVTISHSWWMKLQKYRTSSHNKWLSSNNSFALNSTIASTWIKDTVNGFSPNWYDVCQPSKRQTHSLTRYILHCNVNSCKIMTINLLLLNWWPFYNNVLAYLCVTDVTVSWDASPVFWHRFYE